MIEKLPFENNFEHGYPSCSLSLAVIIIVSWVVIIGGSIILSNLIF